MTAYHVTPLTRVGAIRRHGLIPRDPGRNPHGFTWWGSKNHGIEAVYLLTDRRGAEDWRGNYEVPTAVLEVDIAGYRTQPDAYADSYIPDDHPLRSAIRITNRIPPERVRRVA